MKRVLYASFQREPEGNLSGIIRQLNELPTRRGISKVSLDDVKLYQSLLKRIPVGAVLEHKTDAGVERFTKTAGGEYGWWSHFRDPWKITQPMSEFDTAEWLAGRGVLSRSDISLQTSDHESIEAATSWNSLNSTEQSAAEYAIYEIQHNNMSIEDAVSYSCNMYSGGNAEPEYEDEDFYEEEANYNKVFKYVESYINNI